MPIVSQSGSYRTVHSTFQQLALLVGAALVLVATANAAGFAIDASHVTAGGGRSSSAGGCLRLDASIGQDTLGVSAGGSFAVHAGFWPAIAKQSDALFNNGFQECL